MEKWRLYWRRALAPVLSTAAIKALGDALRADDRRLVQGATTDPPPLMCTAACGVESACAIAFCGWQGEGLGTVGAVEEFFSRVCWEADHRIGDPGECRRFIDWFDDTPRDEMRRELLAEVDRTLAERVSHAAGEDGGRGPVQAAGADRHAGAAALRV